jgi:hypothetical protein
VFACPYSDCDGEFDLTPLVTAMVGDNQKHCSGKLGCQGHRSGEVKQRVACALTLEFEVMADPA